MRDYAIVTSRHLLITFCCVLLFQGVCGIGESLADGLVEKEGLADVFDFGDCAL